MADAYVDAARRTVLDIVELLREIALPLAILLGLLLAAGIVASAIQRDIWQQTWTGLRPKVRLYASYAGVVLLVMLGWNILGRVKGLESTSIWWSESSEASENPEPVAPPVYQFGPLAAALEEHTYSRTLTMPPDFLQRIGAEGIGILAPYLSDPTAEGVLKLVDTLRRSGRDVVFTRDVTRLEELPLPFDKTSVQATFKSAGRTAYDVDFSGTYGFTNTTDKPIEGRFTFVLPQYGGTIRDLHVEVAGQVISEPNDQGIYEWRGPVEPGLSREAKVRYTALGSSKWHYDIGSMRRRVKDFHLDVTSDRPVEFVKGSLLPTSREDGRYAWSLADVVTAQQVNLSFPPDVTQRESYLQALSMLPAAFAAFAIAALIVGLRRGALSDPTRLSMALAALLLAFGAMPILAKYLGSTWAVMIAPLVAALSIATILGPRYSGVATATAFIPAAFLSERHTGLILLFLALIALSSISRAKSDLARSAA